MAAYAAGDAAKFGPLFTSLQRPLRSFFMRRFGDESVADDLLQQTFLKLHRARGDYRPGLPLRPWVFTIAARVGLDERRRRGRRPEDPDESRLSNASAAVAVERAALPSEIERSDIAEKVRAAVAALPAAQREVVMLHRYRDMTFDEVAAELGSTEGAVKLRAFRAYARLRKQLEPLLGRNVPPPAETVQARDQRPPRSRRAAAGVQLAA